MASDQTKQTLVRRTAGAMGLLGLFGLAQRLVLWSTYAPYIAGDTEGAYMRLAEALSGLTLSAYDATRVPGYPLVLLALGQNPQRIWLLQMAAGWILSLLLFWFAWRTTRSIGLAFLLGMLYDLIPAQILFEANILTETLTAFSIIASFVLLNGLERQEKRWTALPVAFLLGIVVCIPGMLRPLLFPLSVWMLLFVLVMVRGNWRRKFVAAALFSIGPLIIQGGWLLWVYQSYHMISPTTLSGYSLVQHTGAFFEYLPDEEAVIRDTYLRYREERIAERGVQTNTIWHAIPELTEVSGMHFFELSRKMGDLSRRLIREHPALYLRSVLKGWIDFWKAPVYWDPTLMQSPLLRSILTAAALIGRGICLLANAAFLALSALSLFGRKIRGKFGIDRYMVAAGGFVLMTAFIQALVDHGDNPRFLVPMQMLVLYVVIRAAWNLSGHRMAEE